MKDSGILNPQLARVIAEMGHGELLVVGDAGLPIPVEVERIDLAFAPGRPAFLEVVETVLAEMRVEACIFASQSRDSCPELVEATMTMAAGVESLWIDHEELKSLTMSARAIVRTGEFTPYANVIFRSAAMKQ